MYNTLKKIIILPLLVIILSSCSVNRPKVNIVKNEYETESENVLIEIPHISGIKNKEFCDEINNKYEQFSDEILNSFINESEITKNKRTKKSKLEVLQNVNFNEDGILSVISEIYKYTEGEMGVLDRKVLNIDINGNKILNLEDIFIDDEYEKMLNQRLEKMSEDAMYSDLWEKPKITDNQNEMFYFDKEGIVIYYPPYELSYYARGFVEFLIKYEDLYGYLKPEYSFLY